MAQGRQKSELKLKKKSILKNNKFLASILGVVTHCFGKVFGTAFEKFWMILHEMDAHRWNGRNATKPQFLLGFKHFEEKAHKAENNQNKPKIDEKIHVEGDIDFQGILNGFWEGFRKQKTLYKDPLQKETTYLLHVLICPLYCLYFHRINPLIRF